MSVLLLRLSAPRAAGAALAALAVLLLSAPAAAASPAAVIRDCQDGSISGKYSARDYSQALRDIPTDVDEYTDCRDVIRRAQLGAAGGTGGGGTDAAGGAGAAEEASAPGTPARPAGSPPLTVEDVLSAASPQDQAAVREAAASAGPDERVVVAGTSVSPADIARGARATSSSLPTPLLIALILVGIGTLAVSAHQLRTRVLGRRPAA